PSPPSTGTCVPSTTVTTPRTTPAANMPPASAPSQCCPTGGIWSEWGPRLNCTDICGAFGTAVRLRTCLTSPGGCPCTGSARTTVPCAFLPCTYPRNSCASGFKASKINGKIRCVANVPPPAETVPPANCCSKGGVWTQWSAWSTCTTKCGSCSRVERTRSCASKRYGCPCA
ncbi:Protein Y8A9A.2, partial [Aphelenchoides avenae]